MTRRGPLNVAAIVLAIGLVVSACATPGPSGSPTPAGTLPGAPSAAASAEPTPDPPSTAPGTAGFALPNPTCGTGRPAADDALPCEAVATIALQAVAREMPDRLRSGVAAIDVVLGPCSPEDVPETVECPGGALVQFVTVAFGGAAAAETSEDAVTVVVEPVTGRVLGIGEALVL